ncbi:fimbria/pilus chaperone family protein [Pseudomonas tritici]|uniref:fimbria/pilus chaperone family protein n=1 Tax=Pseudomonas tritici TaxID=2745518 RepID=UPI00387ABA77
MPPFPCVALFNRLLDLLFSTLVRYTCLYAGALALAFGGPALVLADGMVPDTSVVIVHEEDGEASVSVTNTDSKLALLHVTLEDIPEDSASLLFVTPPLARVEPSKSQLVRFILQSTEPLTTQRLKRVIFEGMPQNRSATQAGHARVGVTVRQNLPVIIHPKGLAPNRTPWTGLAWRLDKQQLSVHNPTPYVVRLAQELRLLPGDGAALLPRTYVLPGETLHVTASTSGATRVQLQPATVYGFAVAPYEAPITL